jgi:hypothetical protein
LGCDVFYHPDIAGAVGGVYQGVVEGLES